MNKKFRTLTEFFSHLNFSFSRKQRYEKNTTLFSIHSSLCSATKSIQIFLRVSFAASKFTPIKLILKRTSPRTPLRVVKMTAHLYNSNSLNCKKRERLNSRFRGWRRLLNRLKIVKIERELAIFKTVISFSIYYSTALPYLNITGEMVAISGNPKCWKVIMPKFNRIS